jgi:hypothetical protein
MTAMITVIFFILILPVFLFRALIFRQGDLMRGSEDPGRGVDLEMR